ncbi:MAG: YggS family pyridoxal phosphate-dependent enzyme, partial [Actinobacteria bacterium]|nr:YggS family pyridoxal phosphate-dependent enzyme [Actinomycetota bacterium]
MSRLDEIAHNLRVVQDRIRVTCEKAKRDVNEITLIAVTKTFGVEDLKL